MKTNLLLRMTSGLALLLALASCAPASHNDVESYRGPASDSSTIIGGVDADVEYARSNGIVGLYDMAKGGLCTGSLIQDNLVLTAGHCINVEQPDKMIIFFGHNFDDIVKQVKAEDYSNIRPVLKVSRHQQYSQGNPELDSMNDIGVVRFIGPLPAGFKKASLATKELAPNIKKGGIVTLSGYGLNEFKRDPTTGATLVSKGSGLLRLVEKIEISDVIAEGKEIVLDQTKGRGACHGDSGGPAYFVDATSQKTFVIGVTSRGDGSCDNVAIYTSVSGYADWIDTESKQLMQ